MYIITYYMTLLMLTLLTLILYNGQVKILTMNFSQFYTFVSLDTLPNLMKYFSCMVIVLSIFIMYFSIFYMSTDTFLPRFMTLMTCFIFSMIIVNNSTSCWAMWLGWEGLGITSFLLIMYYNNWKSMNSAMTTILMNRLGDFCLMTSLLSFTQNLSWSLNNPVLASLLILLVMFATISKSAQMPLMSWLPIAMAAPTPVSSLVHSSTLVVAGSILCLKLSWYFFTYNMLWLSITGYMTSLYASIMAFMELDMKKILAYSTMSQIALVMFMLSCNLKNLMLMHIVNHALIKALLFMNFGVYIIIMFGNQDSRNFSKSNSILWITLSLIVCLLTMCGITFTSSYYSKEYSLLFSMKEESILMFINLMIFMSFAYSTRIIYLIIFCNKSFNPKYMSFWPSLTFNNLLFIIMLTNGWMFMYNFSLPMNLCWMNNKNLILLMPFLISLWFFIHTYTMLPNHDILYQYLNNLATASKYLMSKMKFMSLSFNLNFITFTKNITATKILWPMILLAILLFT
uniref:NADH:ubiquinone reductase (H(+)-translocating) n=1 Tax=Trichuris sp. ETH232 TaxID=2856031 RepID=A0A8F5DQL8_9BILA|nr:NADH dehydrogenase subunit 5 [Trichuris sp. ETH232]